VMIGRGRGRANFLLCPAAVFGAESLILLFCGVQYNDTAKCGHLIDQYLSLRKYVRLCIWDVSPCSVTYYLSNQFD